MSHIIGRGRYARAAYPIGGVQRVGQVPDEIVRYSFDITTGMAAKTVAPIANQLGASPQDTASYTNFAAVVFTVPGGKLGLGGLVVISSGGGSGSKIDLQFVRATVGSPAPVLVPGSLKVGAIDPTQPGGVVGSQLDFGMVTSPSGGSVLGLQAIIPGDVTIPGSLIVSLSIGIYWDPATINNPPA
jgi:hypothetical protein